MKPSEIFAYIQSRGQRLTQQKKTLISVLFKCTDRMLSIQELRERIPDNQQMDNATIYRIIHSLSDLGLLDSMIDEEGVSRYVFEMEQAPHHHMICTSCGRKIDIPCESHYWDTWAKEHGFQEAYHKLEVYGTCAQCRKIASNH